MHRQGQAVAKGQAQLVQQLLKEAAREQRKGRLERAEAACRKALQIAPAHAEVLFRLGMVLTQRGMNDLGIGHLAAALKADPCLPHVWLSLVTLLLSLDRVAEARALLERFRTFHPPSAGTTALTEKLVELLLKHGRQHHKAKRFPQAELIYDTILQLDSGNADAIHLAGVLAWHDGKLEDAVALIDTAISIDDTKVDYLTDLAGVQMARGRWDDVHRCWARVIELEPENARAYAFCGQAQHELGRFPEALSLSERALELRPGYRRARMLLCKALKDLERLDDAVDAYRAWIVDEPAEPVIHNNLGNLIKDMGQAPEALVCFAEAIRLEPEKSLTYSNQIAVSHYVAGVAPETLTGQARRWGEHFSAGLSRAKPFANILDRERPLRLGFISADLRVHAVTSFFEPFLAHVDRNAFEIFAYSNTAMADACTARIKDQVTGWRQIQDLDDDAAARLIEEDGIDILVDLASHTTGHRLLTFARKPAPVQVSWIGFPTTTGLPAMDYQLVGQSIPPEGERYSTETVWRLPHLGMTYQPHFDPPLPRAAPPVDDNDYVTFGFINNLAKVTDEMVADWGRILARVPDSRLLVVAEIDNSPRFRANLEARLAQAGIPPERQILKGRTRDFFHLYNQVDIALDAIPFNGCTTSMDTLWMGVPFLTMRGFHQASRVGEVILNAVGLPELVADGRDAYVELASSLALDRERLRAIRHDLRGRTLRSPLMDHAAMARHAGDAFRGMWRIWVDQQQAESGGSLAGNMAA